MVRVCCAGHVNWDVTLRVDELPAPDGESAIRSQETAGGGSAANVAAVLAGLEVPTGIVGAVGDDRNGRAARSELEAAGVDTTHLDAVEGEATTVKYLLVDDDGRVGVLGNVGANEAVRPADVDREYVGRAEHVHLTGQRPETAAKLAEFASEAGSSVSFDPGRRVAERDFSATLARADLVFVNAREADALLSAEGPVQGDGPVVVRKLGEGGAAIHTPEGRRVHAGFEVSVVDTAGAGDAFAAGFLVTRLDGGGYERALAYANACGALAAREDGARAGPTPDEVASFLDGRSPE